MQLVRRTASALTVLALGFGLTACADDDNRSPEALEGNWVLVEFDEADLPAAPGVTTTITLEGGKMTGNGGVNTLNGTYDAPEDGKVSFSPVASTKMAGEPAAQAQEERFLSELAKVVNFEIDDEDGELELKDDKDNTLVVLTQQ
ncbi:META domain-containing protein [Nocardioides yefusunii]|uniref:META domain-containing protein n=1 Tax=Nocardioides yefusunii TaxID=2500546 RepID=A0ABW1R0Q9_9ACTN|nr:META domain-containing protein [Nocardioides yefusunii]